MQTLNNIEELYVSTAAADDKVAMGVATIMTPGWVLLVANAPTVYRRWLSGTS